MSANPNHTIRIWTEHGTVEDRHLHGRTHDRGAVIAFGQRWTSQWSGTDGDGSWFDLTAMDDDHDGPGMCPACGCFNLDMPDGFNWECTDCPWRAPVPVE